MMNFMPRLDKDSIASSRLKRLLSSHHLVVECISADARMNSFGQLAGAGFQISDKCLLLLLLLLLLQK